MVQAESLDYFPTLSPSDLDPPESIVAVHNAFDSLEAMGSHTAVSVSRNNSADASDADKQKGADSRLIEALQATRITRKSKHLGGSPRLTRNPPPYIGCPNCAQVGTFAWPSIRRRDRRRDVKIAAITAEINRLNAEISVLTQSNLEKAIRTGELLTQIKSQVGHGHWRVWIAENLAFSWRTAARYMALFNHKEQSRAPDRQGSTNTNYSKGKGIRRDWRRL